MVVSVLPLVHGLTAPGVLYGSNQAVMTSVYVALPMAVLVISPLGLGSSGFARWVGRHWRAWALGWSVVAVIMAAGLLRWPNAVTVPGSDHPTTWTVAVGGLAGALWLSRTQLRLHWIGERVATLVASLSLVLLALTSLVWLGGVPFSLGWWVVHAIDIVGVLAGVVGVWSSHRLDRGVIETFEPVLARDPLAALELGLSPVVHQFVRSLEQKDPITRHHVVRTAELAVRVGEMLDLGERRLRYLGLGALLHDIGKLGTADAVLNKPGKLSDQEYASIKRHPIVGDQMLAAVDSLAPAAAFVRHHHERLDGGGYPDRLAGNRIPLESRIIAVCDAYDAMAHTRQYREGMGQERAIAVLREHSGSQWDSQAVEALARVVHTVESHRPALDSVGSKRVMRIEDMPALACDCADALPMDVAADLEDAWRLFARDLFGSDR
jgi:HD-GYP domain-containing protein (c-di-GMP phosphodiesterase class II)